MEEAVDLVLFAYENGEAGDIFVQKAPASTIGDLVQAVRELFNADNEVKRIGIRHGEKKYETLLTKEEASKSLDFGNYFKVPADTRDLSYSKYFVEGDEESGIGEFNSNNTTRLDVAGVKERLLSLEYIKNELQMYTTRVF